MACYHPIPAHQDHPGGPVTLWPPVGTATTQLSCGTCLGCRTDHATDWARRAQHEATLWDNNCFITLTYDDDHLPANGALRPDDLTNFFKRLRRHADRHNPTLRMDRQSHRVRYLACGEYGDTTHRPHYHALLFNCTFADARPAAKDLWQSALLDRIWRHGHCIIGSLTGASANYVAQYTLKKVGYTPTQCDEDGVVKPAPFMRASLKPPIGNGWLSRYATDLAYGYLVTDGKKGRIPRALKKQLAKLDPQLAEQAIYNARKHTRSQHNLESAEKIHTRKNELTNQRKL